MQTICTLLQTDNHTNTSSLNFYWQMLFLAPNQQCQSTEGKRKRNKQLACKNVAPAIYMTCQYWLA